MATQSTTYNTDGSTRTFPSTKPIPTISHVGVYLKRVSDNIWVQVNVGDYTLVQSSIIMDVAPDVLIYSQLEVRVADDPAEITTSPSNIAIVAGDTIAINAVADNLPAVLNVNGNMGAVTSVSANIGDVNAVALDILNVRAVAGDLPNIDAVNANKANIDLNAANIVAIQNASANAATATAQAGIATDQAGLASTSASNASASETLAQKWASEVEDVVVSGGLYSAFHWAKKALAYAASINPLTLVRKDSDTGIVYLTAGTTAQRPVLANGVVGIRYNTTLLISEIGVGTLTDTIWGSVGGGATGSGTDKIFHLNDQTVTASYTIPTGKNAGSFGAITISDNVTVTIPDGSVWTIV